jgi:hypothetical protein
MPRRLDTFDVISRAERGNRRGLFIISETHEHALECECPVCGDTHVSDSQCTTCGTFRLD